MSLNTLYHFPISHYCEKVRWVLDYKGIVHTKKTLLPGLHVKKMLKATGQSSVPVFKHQDQYLHNSALILDYLEQHYPDKPLMPGDPGQAAKVKQWEAYVDEHIGSHVRVFMYHYLLQKPDIVIGFFTHKGPFYGRPLLKMIFPTLEHKMRKYMKINAETAGIAKAKLDQGINTLNEALQGRDFLVGDHFTRADLTAASLLAPLLMPEGYGLKKPQPLPTELQTLLDGYEPQLGWVKHLYSGYR